MKERIDALEEQSRAEGAGADPGETGAVAEAPGPAADRGGAGLPDVLRKALVTGLGAAIMTEEGLRAAFKDLKLPKEAVNTALGQAGRGKDELLRVVNDEVRSFLESPALKREIARALSNITIELTAKIRLNPDGSGPDISFGQPRIRREPPSPTSSPEQEAGEVDEARAPRPPPLDETP